MNMIDFEKVKTGKNLDEKSTKKLSEMEECMEVDVKLYFMDRMERKARDEAEDKQKIARNPVYRLACLCGLV